MLEQYHNDRLISEENYLKAHATIMDAYTSESTSIKQKKQAEEIQKSMEPYEHMADATLSISDAFTDLTENMNESSGAYRSLFCGTEELCRSECHHGCVQAWIKALNDPEAVTWPQKLACVSNGYHHISTLSAYLRFHAR